MIEEKAKTDGVRVRELLFELTESIYKKMSESDCAVVYNDGNKITSESLNKLKQPFSRFYMGNILYMVLGVDREYWSGEYNFLEQHGMVEILKPVLISIEEEDSKLIGDMTEQLNQLMKIIDDCLRQLEDIRYSNVLPGKCNLLRAH